MKIISIDISTKRDEVVQLLRKIKEKSKALIGLQLERKHLWSARLISPCLVFMKLDAGTDE